MPKDLVYPLPKPDGSDADCRVEVGWHPNGDVQIATTVLHPDAGRNDDYVPGTSTEPRRAWDGQWIGLTRVQVNDLIRLLRKARDAAFGRDE